VANVPTNTPLVSIGQGDYERVTHDGKTWEKPKLPTLPAWWYQLPGNPMQRAVESCCNVAQEAVSNSIRRGGGHA
jgi:hypothetical protein